MKKMFKGLMAVSVSGFIGMLMFGANGNAYIDPSVTTFLIQAIAGVVIAVGAALGIYFRKAKKKVDEKFNIDENRNKEVESDEILVSGNKQ